MATESQRRVDPYPDPPKERQRLEMETYEYRMPFNYPNVTVNRRYLKGMEFHGVEMNPINSIGMDQEHLPPDNITIEEDDPIIRVVVIGSACTPPGWVQVEAFPTPDFHKPVDVPGTAATRFRINNLWGTHLRYDTWAVESGGDMRDSRGRSYDPLPEARKAIRPGLRKYDIKAHYRENPLVGMSCAIFEIPRSPRVIITGGSEICAWSDDDFPDDVHYSFTIIRTTLAVGG